MGGRFTVGLGVGAMSMVSGETSNREFQIGILMPDIGLPNIRIGIESQTHSWTYNRVCHPQCSVVPVLTAKSLSSVRLACRYLER